MTDRSSHRSLDDRLGIPPARSALTLRLALAVFGVLVCAAGVVLVPPLPLRLLFALLAVVAVIDIVVVARRLRTRRRGDGS